MVSLDNATDVRNQAYWLLNVTNNTGCSLNSAPTESRNIYIHLDSDIKYEHLTNPAEGEYVCFERRNDICGSEFILADELHPLGKLSCSLNLDIHLCPDINGYSPMMNQTHLCLSNNQGQLNNSVLYVLLVEDLCFTQPSCLLLTITEVYRLGDNPFNDLSESIEVDCFNETTTESDGISQGVIIGSVFGAAAIFSIVSVGIITTACLVRYAIISKSNAINTRALINNEGL